MNSLTKIERTESRPKWASPIEDGSIVTLSGKEYSELSLKLGKDGVVGGRSYDLLHLACAEKSRADRIFTFNIRHFSELAGHVSHRITAP
jgi:hypothetical protein